MVAAILDTAPANVRIDVPSPRTVPEGFVLIGFEVAGDYTTYRRLQRAVDRWVEKGTDCTLTAVAEKFDEATSESVLTYSAFDGLRWKPWRSQ